ncbi:hypothetical protein HYALB_00001544 [Hymenoscyphus albidus]|uniref:Phospholipid/glycerol acyltransferase domain-containing protein n=1 Tax=Hymenoscyphus albidus TaxID=595503 RepID=A0A9N9L8W5_9HELO|nr:hypothetical protein HYALB_00001544 [Hymenoscyphus albidus]
MANETVRQRKQPETKPPPTEVEASMTDEHPGGDIKHNPAVQILRLLAVLTYFLSACTSIVATQLLGVPLYWISRDWYYAYMAQTKQSFGIAVTTLTQWWAPTVVRISGDASVANEMRKTADGRVELNFPERIVMIANHQIYSDWLYLWWAGYTNKPHMHGHIYIILKESLKYIPIVGWGMQFYGFVFMSRKMEKDQPRLAHRLNVLKQVHSGPMSGSTGLDPMWLMLFPEGTNLSKDTRSRSAKWAEKTGLKDMVHVLTPRSTGSFFCLNELKGTVDCVYDCTLAYEGVPRGQYGQDLYTLRSMYLQGRPPPSVSMYWRKFAMADIPLDNSTKFEHWLRERWLEKDDLLEQQLVTGYFPASKSSSNGATKNGATDDGFIETEVKLANWWEVGKIYLVLATAGLASHWLVRCWFLLSKAILGQ